MISNTFYDNYKYYKKKNIIKQITWGVIMATIINNGMVIGHTNSKNRERIKNSYYKKPYTKKKK